MAKIVKINLENRLETVSVAPDMGSLVTFGRSFYPGNRERLPVVHLRLSKGGMANQVATFTDSPKIQKAISELITLLAMEGEG